MGLDSASQRNAAHAAAAAFIMCLYPQSVDGFRTHSLSCVCVYGACTDLKDGNTMLYHRATAPTANDGPGKRILVDLTQNAHAHPEPGAPDPHPPPLS